MSRNTIYKLEADQESEASIPNIEKQASAIIYNTDLKSFAGCNGEFWTALGAGGQSTISGDLILASRQSGQTINVDTTAIIGLPPISVNTIGMVFTFRNIGADGTVQLSIDPKVDDAIHGTVGAVSSSGALDKDFINTLATANKGDWLKVEAVALTEWYITGGVGVWASEI